MSSPITPDHLYNLTTVSDPSLAPSGDRLAFVRSRIDRESMETRSQVLMRLADGRAFEFTRRTRRSRAEALPRRPVAGLRPAR